MRRFVSRTLQVAGAALGLRRARRDTGPGRGRQPVGQTATATRRASASIADTGRGSALLMEPCNLDAHQGWRFGIKIGNGPTYPPPTDGHSRIRSQDADAAGRCLTAHGHAEPVTMEPCAGPDSEIYDRQAWTSSAPSGNWFGLWNRGAFTTVQCLDVRDRGRSDVVQNVTCGPANQGNQRWKLY